MVWPLPELPMRLEALPCPLEAGWALIRLWELPKRADNGLSLGGFSAAAHQASNDRLWLVSVDNFSLVQRNLVGLLAPCRSPRCRSLPES